MRRRVVLVACAISTVLALPAFQMAAHGDDWPMFGRDKTRNMVSPERNAPMHWRVGDGEPAENIKWSARLGTHSCGAPVISGGLVWVGTNNGHPRDLDRKGDASVLMCFRESDGEFLYQYVSPRLASRANDWEITSLASSPLIEGDRLWFCTNRCETVCLDIGPLRRGDGEPKLVWNVDMIERLGVVPSGVMIGSEASHCSIGASYAGLIYVNTNNGARNEDKLVPAAEAPSLVCFRKNTGEVVWQDNSPGHDIIDVQHGSPLVVEAGGRSQVIAAQGDGWLRSFHPLTGELLWKFDMNAKEAEWRRGLGTRNYVLAAPVLYEDRVYIASGRHVEFGGGPGRLCCIDPTKSGDVSSQLLEPSGNVRSNPNSGLVWEFGAAAADDIDRMHNTISTVGIADGLVIAPDLAGYVHCLDAATGTMYWTHDMLVTSLGSPLIVDGKIYVGDEEGQVMIFKLSKNKNMLATEEMGQIIYSTPVFASGVLYVLTSTDLFAIQSQN